MGEKLDRFGAISLLLFTAFLWSLGGIFIKNITWSAVSIAGARSLIAIPILLLVVRKKHIDWSWEQIGGAVCYTITMILFVMTNKLTTAANAILLQYTAPIYVALLSAWLLHEKVHRFDWIAIAIALCGIALFFFDQLSFENHLGNILALLSGLSFAFMIILMRKQKDSHPIGSAFLGNVFTGLICLPFMIKGPAIESGWISLICLGVFQVGLAYVIYSIAIKRVTAMEGTLIPIIEPIINPLWVFLFHGEQPGQWALAGGLIVLTSVAARSVMSLKYAAKPSPLPVSDDKSNVD